MAEYEPVLIEILVEVMDPSFVCLVSLTGWCGSSRAAVTWGAAETRKGCSETWPWGGVSGFCCGRAKKVGSQPRKPIAFLSNPDVLKERGGAVILAPSGNCFLSFESDTSGSSHSPPFFFPFLTI